MIDTRKLETFATSARTGLITEVTARLNAVLSPSSTARVESSRAIKALESDITRHGGDAKGRKHVAEQQAYVWFNRIIAFRFMDANGYTKTAVVSPEAGRTTGQPAILAAAKRGEYDPEVYTNPKTVQRITGLLNGTIPSADRDGEAYGLILNAHCAHWNRAMPFMFQPEGDYTELLMPSNLLAEGSVLAKAVQAMAAEDCQDVEVIGWLYQFYITERKQEVFDSFSKGKKAGADEIPAATQLFTPDYIVRYLVQNSVGRLWMLNHPRSKLIDQMEYYIAPVGEPGEFLKIEKPKDLTVMDPACGSGHMLTYAFDLLYSIYAEEGYAPSEIPGSILSNNLFGTEIDGRAGALAAFALTMKARARQRRFFSNPTQPNICVIQPVSFDAIELEQLITKGGDKDAEVDFWNSFAQADTLGSLIQPYIGILPIAQNQLTKLYPTSLDEITLHDKARRVIAQANYLTRQYSVVVANPPYMGTKSMTETLSRFLSETFPLGKVDLYAAFILRNIALAACTGIVAMITMQSWMFQSTFLQLRKLLLDNHAVSSLLHLGPRSFNTISGEVVQTVAFSLTNDYRTRNRFVCIRLVAGESEAEKAALLSRALVKKKQTVEWFETDTTEIARIPGNTLAYWMSSSAANAFEAKPPLHAQVDIKAGISTGNNSQFQRLWFEVSRRDTSQTGSQSGIGKRRWAPCSSGGRFRRWYGNNAVVVDWENGGIRIKNHPSSALRNLAFMGNPALTFSKIGGDAFAVRKNEEGFVFDDTGRSIFPKASVDPLWISAVLNSSACQFYLGIMTPGMSFTSTELGAVPYPGDADDEQLLAVRMLTTVSKLDWDDFETSWDFHRDPLVAIGEGRTLADTVAVNLRLWDEYSARQQSLEEENNRIVAGLYDLEDKVPCKVSLERVSLTRNTAFRYPSQTKEQRGVLFSQDAVKELVSYAVGCMFGRYSLDEPGLILASQGETLKDYLERVPEPSFYPDNDNVIPIMGVEWFGDDVVARFRQFLKVSFGAPHLQENLAFIEKTLGKSLRQYFLKDFYKDHVQRYKNRPIYWLFSSRPDGKGVFNALVYLHRYSPATLNNILNEYLREFQAKLRAEIAALERSGGSANLQQADTLSKALTECEDYERDILYPLVSRNLQIDLDDGVLVNYLRFGDAVVRIPAIEKKRSEVEKWTWPHYPLKPEGGA